MFTIFGSKINLLRVGYDGFNGINSLGLENKKKITIFGNEINFYNLV